MAFQNQEVLDRIEALIDFLETYAYSQKESPPDGIYSDGQKITDDTIDEIYETTVSHIKAYHEEIKTYINKFCEQKTVSNIQDHYLKQMVCRSMGLLLMLADHYEDILIEVTFCEIDGNKSKTPQKIKYRTLDIIREMTKEISSYGFSVKLSEVVKELQIYYLTHNKDTPSTEDGTPLKQVRKRAGSSYISKNIFNAAIELLNKGGTNPYDIATKARVRVSGNIRALLYALQSLGWVDYDKDSQCPTYFYTNEGKKILSNCLS